MADPVEVNLTPSEGEEFSPTQPIYFGVRDSDNRVDQSSVVALATFSSVVYEAQELPLQDPFLFDIFRDGVPDTATANRADLVLDTSSMTVGDDVLVLTAPGTKSSNTLFCRSASTPDRTCGAEFRFSAPVLPAKGPATEYQTNGDYNGVMLGMAHWASNTGIFIFCCDDAGTKYLEIGGPAEDASGTRTTVRFDHDWTQPTHSIRIVFDASGHTGKAYVLLTEETTGVETRAYEEDITALSEFLASTRLGFIEPGAGDVVSCFIGIDQDRAGELEIYKMTLEGHGEALVSGGGVVFGQTGTAEATGLLYAATRADVARMRRNSFTFLDSSESLIFRSAASEDANSMLRSVEPRFVNDSWLMFFRGRPQQAVHTGSYNTGVGFDVSNETSLFRLRFLDDGTKQFGFYDTTSGNTEISDSYERVALAWDDFAAEVLTYLKSSELFCTAAERLIETTDFSFRSTALTALADSGPARLDLGFLDEVGASYDYEGFFTVSNFFFMPAAEIAHEGDFSAWAWNSTAAAETDISNTVSAVKEIRPTGTDQYGFYSLSYAAQKYSEGVSGISVLLRAKIGDFTDQFDQENPVRIPSPALIGLSSTPTGYVQLQFVTSESSETFVFVSQDSQDYKEVLNPTSEAGQLISAQIDPTVEHYYLLAYQPGKGLRLFIDFENEPSIDIPWEDVSAASKADLDNLMSGLTVSIGSIPTLSFGAKYNRMDVDLRMAAVCLGSGYDYAVTIGASRETLESKIYGTKANTFIDFLDTD
jgi:hypothetical protein